MSCRVVTAAPPASRRFTVVLAPVEGDVPRRVGRYTMPYAIDFNGPAQNIKFAVPSRKVMFAPI